MSHKSDIGAVPGAIDLKPLLIGFGVLVASGAAGFFSLLVQGLTARAWQSMLVNFLLWSSLAQGGVLFSVVMHLTKARWSRGLSGLSESLAAFFPVSLALFILLLFGRNDVFPWLGKDLHGKEAWLNLPFLFSRDMAGLMVLYGLGTLYVIHAMMCRQSSVPPPGPSTASTRLRRLFLNPGGTLWERREQARKRMTIYAILYAVAYAVVLSLIAYDLVLAADWHFVSTLFGAYSFVKAFYVGIAALIVMAAILRMFRGPVFAATDAQLHDMGKLLLGFCLIWADFFYCQLVVIWYGNIPEETAYVIARTMVPPWRGLAWFVFIVCFGLPFLVLLNRSVKSRPFFMSILGIFIIMGIWLEHFLLVGPAFFPEASKLPLGFAEGLMFIGFFGLLGACVTVFLYRFPEFARPREPEVQ